MAAERTILIVDDCPEDRAEIRRLLLTGTERRLRLVEASTGDEGVAAATGVDAMVLDNRLPDMDALDVLRARNSHAARTRQSKRFGAWW